MADQPQDGSRPRPGGGDQARPRKRRRARTTPLYPWQVTLSLPAAVGERVERASETGGVAVPEVVRQAVIAGLPLLLDRYRHRKTNIRVPCPGRASPSG